MSDSIFNVDALRANLERLELADVARRTVECAEDYMPGCAWLDAAGEIRFAETMSEVDGLVLCQAHEPGQDDEDQLCDCFWVGGWVRDLGLAEIAEQLEAELLMDLDASA